MGVLVNLPSTRPVGGVHARLNAVYLNCLGSYALFARSSALPYGPNQIFNPSGSGISWELTPFQKENLSEEETATIYTARAILEGLMKREREADADHKVHYTPHTSLFLEKVGKIRDFVDTALEAYKPLP